MRFPRRRKIFAAGGEGESGSTNDRADCDKAGMKALLPFLFFLLFNLCEGRAEEALKQWELEVDGVKRSLLVYAPEAAKTSPAPVVFAFHGHGGSAQGAVRMFGMNRHWPEALSVYMQGLNTPGRLTDPEGKKPGWQSRVGMQEDRDLHFFDAVIARLKAEFKVDEQRLFACGHSNGGSFTYLLWAERGELLAGVGPSGSAAAENRPKLKPKPAMHVAGQNDPLVKYEWQEATIAFVKQLNGCTGEGAAWAPNAQRWDSPGGKPFVAYVHPGGHEFPPDAAPLLARFFREVGTASRKR
jgi:polyhydroxybutyrate depolymerase